MSTVVILVVDGLGVGAMPDAGQIRPGDVQADTLGHVLDTALDVKGEPLRLPTFGGLGLGVVHPHDRLAPTTSRPVAVGRAGLGYPGADTFAGHQTMMGADMSGTAVVGFAKHLDAVAAALRDAGHKVEVLRKLPVLHVDDAVVVGDNLEADPGLNWNASGRLEDVDFLQILGIAEVVRAVAPVARIIAVGGRSSRPLLDAVRAGDGGTAGLDTPASGFYLHPGLQVVHLGCSVDRTRQLPTVAARAGIPVTLIGKAADILDCEEATRIPAVPTQKVLAATLDAIGHRGGLIVVNIQETDLAGHQQDPARYGQLLEQIDGGLKELLDLLEPNDVLLVTGDHGNDPTIGHAYHTREYVPVLCHSRQWLAQPRLLEPIDTLADIGATAAVALGLDATGLQIGRQMTANRGPLFK